MADKEQYEDEEDDVHICGLCRAQFKDVEDFINHKKSSCPVRLARLQQRQLKNKDPSDFGAIKKPVECAITYQNVDSGQLTNIVYSTAGGTIGEYDKSLNYITVSQITQPGTSVHSLHRDMGNKPGTSLHYTVPQAEFVEIETEGGPNALSHDYVILASSPSEDVSSERSEYQSHDASAIYKLTSQADQNFEIQTSSQSHTIQASISNPQDVGKKILELQSSPLQLLSHANLEKEGLVPDQHSFVTNQQSVISGQQTVRQLLSAQEDRFAPQVSIASHDVYMQKEMSSAQQMPMEYTLSVEPQRADDFEDQSRKVNPYETSEYNEHIQYTLSSAVQNELSPIVNKEPVTVTRATTKDDNSNSPRAGKASPNKKDATEKKKAPLDKKFQCSFNNCTYKTAYLKDLERHNRIHTGEKPYQCTKCDKAFNRNDKLVLHLRYHMNERSFKCDLCEYSAVERGSLKKHMKCHLDERPFSCQVCPYKSRSASQLQIHLRTHTGDTPYSCHFCTAVFKVGSDLRRHLRTHTGEKPFICEYSGCSYRCAVKSNLTSHYRTNHADNLEYKCESCDFKSCSKKLFFEHKKKHDVNPDLTCSTCDYQCSNKSALKNHVRIHNKETFSCNYCSYKSVQSGNVQAHMRRKHPTKTVRKQRRSKLEPALIQRKESSEDTDVPKRGNVKTKCQQNFKCDQCKAAFVREDSLKCHLKQHKDKCSSLSTAYAVLKLQQPVINPPTSQPLPTNIVNNPNTPTTSEAPSDICVMSTTIFPSNNQQASPQQLSIMPLQSQLSQATFQGHMTSVQGHVTSVQGQGQTSQGINDILLAAGMTGLSSTGNSPTMKHPETPIAFHELQTVTSGNITSKLSIPTTSFTDSPSPSVVISSSMDKQAPILQNISLPYMRLPNGQVLILTGQNQSGQIITSQTESFNIGDETIMLSANPLNTQQFFPQPVFTDHQSSIQSATMEGANVTLEQQIISDTQQSGAIPIQIILPSDSQQPFPFVSHLINSVVNREGLMPGQASGNINPPEKFTVSEGNVQNFVVHIPAQTGLTKDTAGNVQESRSFVLQIPGPNTVN